MTTDNTTETPNDSTDDNPHLLYILRRWIPFLAEETSTEALVAEIGSRLVIVADAVGTAADAIGTAADASVRAALADQARTLIGRAVAAGTVPPVRAELLATGLDIAFHLGAAARGAFPPARDDLPTSTIEE